MNGPAGGKIPTKEAKQRVLQYFRVGKTVDEAMALVQRGDKCYERWRQLDGDFRNAVNQIRELRAMDAAEKRKRATRTFEEFRENFLGMRTFDHQRQWIDLIEGKPLTGLHPSIKYEPGDPNFILINTAPEHSKSITLSVDYPTYLIATDPSVRVLLVSETQKRAKEFLYAIKQRLSHPRYHEFHLAYAPAEGYKATADSWRDDMIYLGSEVRDSAEKDPTVQAIGIGGQIYGARATHIILDDCVVLQNAHGFETAIRWIQQEVLTRLGPTGKLVIAGTRVDSQDLYREIRNPDRYPGGESPWTYLAQPAVLEFADDPKDWVTLWPKSDHPWPGSDEKPDKDGLYSRWNGKHLHRRRAHIDPKTWSMVYQQADTTADSIFKATDVARCVNGNRVPGPLQKGNKYHRDGQGMDGLYVCCSMDPAMSGDTASIAYALDLQTHKRYVLDTHRMTAPSPQKIRDLIMAWTERYRPQCWVIEKNAFQLFLTRDEEIRSYLASRGVIMREHYTSRNKLDPDFGVASVAPLFTEQLIELPSRHKHEATKALVEQLVTWAPGMRPKDLKQDLPMALWFAELIAREVVDARTMHTRQHRDSRFVPRYARRNQTVIRLDDYLAEREDYRTGSGGTLSAV